MASIEPEQSFDSTTSEPVDLASTPHSLARAVYARRSEYVRRHRIRVKVGSWNVAGCANTEKDLALWFVDGQGVDKRLTTVDEHNPAVEDSQQTNRAISSEDHDEVRVVGGDKIGIYVLGLQEIVDLNVARDAVTRITYTDNEPMNRWKNAVAEAMPRGYQMVMAEQMSGLMLLVYASPDVAPTITNVSTVQVGTGLFGYMGNKGAVTTRILLGETTRMVFVNCHLASGAEQTYLDRRLWDYNQILARTNFEPVRLPGAPEDEAEKIGDEDFGFWLGDLNFRLDGLPGPDIRRLLMLHTRGEYDLSKKTKAMYDEDSYKVKSVDDDDDTSDMASTVSSAASYDDTTDTLPDPDDFEPDAHDDPASLQATLDSLLPHDQLRRVKKEKKAFHEGWREGPITFLPSYKYDVGTVSLFDSSEKQRAPSWCDRILYRTRTDKEEYEKSVREAEAAKKRDAEMKAQGLETAAEDDDVLFSYDPDADADAEVDDPARATSSTGYDDYDEYDEQEDAPAEEVVTKEGFTDRIELEIYTSHQRIISSDHKPVISIFSLDYDAVVPELKAKIHGEVARELDRAENEGRPLITIVVDNQDGTVTDAAGQPADQGEPLDFGNIAYLQKHNMSLTVANTGQAPAKFSFVEKPESSGDEPVQGAWLTTSFKRRDEDDADATTDAGKEVVLEPGDTVTAFLEVVVKDTVLLRNLNAGKAKLEDILVLRVEDGRDHFIPVRATWLPSCFGRSIEELIRVPNGGIRAFLASSEQGAGPIPLDSEVHSAAPKELFKLTELVETLTARVLADESMLDQRIVPADKQGWPFDSSSWLFADKAAREAQVIALVEAIDTDGSLAEALPLDAPSIHRLEIAVEVLLLFLATLLDGIIPADIWTKTEAALPNLSSALTPARPPAELEDDKAAVLDVLAATPNHNISFVFLTATLAKMAGDLSPVSRTDAEALTAAQSAKRFSRLARRMTAERQTAEAALARRRTRERKFAEALGKVVCRAATTGVKDKERKATEDRMRVVVEMFVRKSLEDL
ncbi:type II inositol-1,4,5-trisphosphate 5-phosphatase [Plectosphaerella plurivora]|uniref:Type II inositol-1,4,5-trisphosphate 5-phosphatase n=1 Tax=Plectosphaerella plurivora TaxID=936078 RepID=A0A9P8V322_9PEZI|nr:type II inositol-1,4,5-trisphosphate 5-phosphatase [Plectosphaerella plurivora]